MPKDWTGNLHSVFGCLGTNNGSTKDREENDYYATEPKATELLLNLEKLSLDILEPACGEGHIAKVLMNVGFNVVATDLIDRGFGGGGYDFLKRTEKFNGDIVTNPPFRYAQEFVEHALEIVTNGHKVIMFLKLQFLEGIKRRKLFNNNPPKRVWVSSSRLRCGKNGVFSESMVAYARFVWEKGYKGETTLRRFN